MNPPSRCTVLRSSMALFSLGGAGVASKSRWAAAGLMPDGKTPPGLGDYLKQRGIQRLFVTGLATDFCVAWTVMDARKAGFKTWVIEDATRADIDLNGSLAVAWEQRAKKVVKRSDSKDLTLA